MGRAEPSAAQEEAAATWGNTCVCAELQSPALTQHPAPAAGLHGGREEGQRGAWALTLGLHEGLVPGGDHSW